MDDLVSQIRDRVEEITERQRDREIQQMYMGDAAQLYTPAMAKKVRARFCVCLPVCLCLRVSMCVVCVCVWVLCGCCVVVVWVWWWQRRVWCAAVARATGEGRI